MKKSLLLNLLLISGIIYSQDSIPDFKVTQGGYSIDEYGRLCSEFTIDTVWCSEQNSFYQLLSLWEYYKLKCYKDSIIVGYRYIFEENIFNDGSRMELFTEVYILNSHPKYKDDHILLNHSYIDDNGTIVTEHYFKPPDDYIREEIIKEPYKYPTFEEFMDWLILNLKIKII
jgi:hypothetical protein